MPKKEEKIKKTKNKPEVCVELRNGKTVCFTGTLEATRDFIDLIGSGDLKIKSIE